MLDELYNRISVRSKLYHFHLGEQSWLRWMEAWQIVAQRCCLCCPNQPPSFPKSLPSCHSPLLPFLFFNLPSAPQTPSSSSPSFIITTSARQGLLSSFNPHHPKPQSHKESHVSQRRHHALRDRLLVRHSRSRSCLRIREVLSTLLLPVHGSSFRFSIPIATSVATTLIPFDRSSCQPRTRCNPSCPPFIVGSNAFSSPSVFLASGRIPRIIPLLLRYRLLPSLRRPRHHGCHYTFENPLV